MFSKEIKVWFLSFVKWALYLGKRFKERTNKWVCHVGFPKVSFILRQTVQGGVQLPGSSFRLSSNFYYFGWEESGRCNDQPCKTKTFGAARRICCGCRSVKAANCKSFTDFRATICSNTKPCLRVQPTIRRQKNTKTFSDSENITNTVSRPHCVNGD